MDYQVLSSSDEIDYDKECSICLEDLEKGDQAVLSCKVKHKFHYVCFGNWFYNKNNKLKFTCPLCLEENVEVCNVIKSKKDLITPKYSNYNTTWPDYKKAIENQNIRRQQQNDENIEVDFCCGVLGCLIL